MALHETQRPVVSDKTGHHYLLYESETGFCVPIDPGGELVTPVSAWTLQASGWTTGLGPLRMVPLIHCHLKNGGDWLVVLWSYHRLHVHGRPAMVT
jgi:hypothetical protein